MYDNIIPGFVQQTDISDVHEQCLPLDIPYLMSPWR